MLICLSHTVQFFPTRFVGTSDSRETIDCLLDVLDREKKKSIKYRFVDDYNKYNIYILARKKCAHNIY